MKKNLLLQIAMALVMAMPIAAKPVITFSNRDFNFGQIYESNGRVTARFIYQNNGNEELIINNVRSGCGCLTPQWDKNAIAPGQSSEIIGIFNPNGRSDGFSKTMMVYTNASEEPIVLRVQGFIISKAQEEAIRNAQALKSLQNNQQKPRDIPCLDESYDVGTEMRALGVGTGATREVATRIATDEAMNDIQNRLENKYPGWKFNRIIENGAMLLEPLNIPMRKICQVEKPTEDGQHKVYLVLGMDLPQKYQEILQQNL